MREYLEGYERVKAQCDGALRELGAARPTAQVSVFFYPYCFDFGGDLSTKNTHLAADLGLDLAKWRRLDRPDNQKEPDDPNALKGLGKLESYLQDLPQNYGFFERDLSLKMALFVGENESTAQKVMEVQITRARAVFLAGGIAIIALFVRSEGADLGLISTGLNRELRYPSHLFIKNGIFYALESEPPLKNEPQSTDFRGFDAWLRDEILGANCELNEIKDGRTKYAKFITAAHAQVPAETARVLLCAHPLLQHETDSAITPLNIAAHILGSANDFAPKNAAFEHDLDYLRSQTLECGVRIYSHLCGVAGLNSLAFISINDGGGGIVRQCERELFLIFLINYYVKLRLAKLDRAIVSESLKEQSFKRNLSELIKLKTNFWAEEPADSIVPNLVNTRLRTAFGTEAMMEKIEAAIEQNTDFSTARIAAVVAFLASCWAVIGEFATMIETPTLLNTAKLIIVGTGAVFLGLWWWAKKGFTFKRINQ